MTSTLFALNDAPHGNERAYNGCGWPARWRPRTTNRCTCS